MSQGRPGRPGSPRTSSPAERKNGSHEPAAGPKLVQRQHHGDRLGPLEPQLVQRELGQVRHREVKGAGVRLISSAGHRPRLGQDSATDDAVAAVLDDAACPALKVVYPPHPVSGETKVPLRTSVTGEPRGPSGASSELPPQAVNTATVRASAIRQVADTPPNLRPIPEPVLTEFAA